MADLKNYFLHAGFQGNENVILTEQIEIEPGSEANEATFKVRNLTERTIPYPGYEWNHNALVWITQKGKISDALNLPCWVGYH